MRFPPRLAPALLVLAAVTPATAADTLEAGFAAPPPAARPLVWWHWINGNVTKHGIEADLADMKRVGIAGVQMFDASIYLPPGPVRYGTDTWHEHVQHAIATADRLGLEFHLMNTPGWSASGGPWVTPERSMKKLVWSETAADGAPALTLALKAPEIPSLKFRTPHPVGPQRNFYRDVAVLAVPATATRRTPEWERKTKLEEKSLTAPPLDLSADGCIARPQVLDLTARFDAATNTLRTALPAGAWTILRFGFTSTGSTNHPAVPEGHGLEIDKMDAEAVSFYFDQALGRILREAGPRVGRTLQGLLFDSFEGGPQNWTDTFPAQFRALKGYDFLPLLPVLTGRVIESPTFTEAALRDFRGAVEALIAKNYFGTMQRRAREHGMVLYAEAQGGPLNPVSCGGYVDVPMNEFWLPDTAPRLPRIKLAASVAHVLGRPLVAAEAFTAKPEDGRWLATPATLKDPGDYAWTAGINRFILHHYVHQPTDDGPGFGLGRYGTHFGRLNTWWPLAGAWIDYVARGQFLLQQGRTVADIAFLQNEDHGYAFPTAMTHTPSGYDYDIVYPHHLATMTWRGGALTLPTGPAYRVLMLPENWTADLATLRKLRELARAGAPIFGSPPLAPAGRRDYDGRDEFNALVSELWGDKSNVPRPPIRPVPLPAALKETGLTPDVGFPALSTGGELRFIHRRTADAEIYFVFNHSDRSATGDFAFRVPGHQPELWNAITGAHADAPAFRTSATTTTVPLELEPRGSIFVVFRRTATAPHADAPKTTLASTLQIAGPWRVAFHDGRGAPPEATFAALASWTTHADPGIKFYSGTATYRTTFTIDESRGRGVPPRATATLDLGTVADLAEVRLNGALVRTLWQPPFRVDVTPHLRVGDNTLEVRVANRWINRVIGDESLPTDLTYQPDGTNKFTDGKLNQLPAWLYDRAKLGDKRRHSFTTWKHYDATSSLVPAGLLGPVTIEWRTAASR
ncbi:MAG: hypothetical protein HZA93_09840 [Verrucomicrobia bacterium]|nr:hypothetical protein [Verrucomicrobiota bacterium]